MPHPVNRNKKKMSSANQESILFKDKRHHLELRKHNSLQINHNVKSPPGVLLGVDLHMFMAAFHFWAVFFL